jgi:hypothetical protein
MPGKSGLLSLIGTRSRSGTQMKSFLIAFCGVALVLSTSLPALAQHGQGGARSGRPEPARPRPQQAPTRDPGSQDQHPQRDPRMTPEQRRQLRRDVNDHGRDIYRDRSNPNRP